MDRLTATVQEDSDIPVVGAPSDIPVGTQIAGRFVVNGALGRGSSGEVLAVQDLSLDREVAMKVLRGGGGPALARFVREARVTARLDHPGVPPVHMLEFLPDGGLIFTMRRLDGLTLGEAIRRASAGQAPPVLASVNATVNLGLRLCEALSRAHFLGIVHCDVKPDNVMLGSHGEVALVDWGECRVLDQVDHRPAGSAVGTPAYMSPEQARGETADQRSDIYALGATLWHALTRRLPTWDEYPERFWDKKRAGIVDPLPREAAARVPRQLLAILRRALTAAPEGRYASIADLAADLERFQAGQAVAAYRESPPERLLRWLRSHRSAIAVTAAVLAVCLAAGGVLWRQHLRTLAEWGPPIYVEDFEDDSWRSRWVDDERLPGQYAVQDGRLVTTGVSGSRCSLTFDRVLAGAVAIEYEAEMLPGCQPGDLSVAWIEDPGQPAGRWSKPGMRTVLAQIGGNSNYITSINDVPDVGRVTERAYRLQCGVRYRIRVEIDGRKVAMWIDGEPHIEAELDLPIATGRLALYAYRPGKAYDRIRIYQKRLPQVTSVLAIGEAYLRDHAPARAASAFREVADSHPGTPLAVEARYRQGLALREAGDRPAALAAWGTLPPGEQARRVEAHRLDQVVAEGRVAEACAAFATLYRRSPELHHLMRRQWQQWATRAASERLHERDPAGVDALIEVPRSLFPRDYQDADDACVSLLLLNQRLVEAVEWYPDSYHISLTLMAIGRAEQVLQRFADSPSLVYVARLTLGRFDEILADGRSKNRQKSWALCQMGHAADLAAADPPDPLGLLWQGDAERALEMTKDGWVEIRSCALAALGRWDEAQLAAEKVGKKHRHKDIAMLGGLRSPLDGGANPLMPGLGWRLARLAAAGEADLLGRLLAAEEPLWPNWDDWIRRILVVPLVRGDAVLLRERLELAWREGRNVAAQRPHQLASVVLGHLPPEALDVAPCAGEAVLWRAVAVALTAELSGDRAATAEAWRAYLALPWHRRLTGDSLPDPALEALAQWRAAVADTP